jgi:predicted secreted Zn-dependent protease
MDPRLIQSFQDYHDSGHKTDPGIPYHNGKQIMSATYGVLIGLKHPNCPKCSWVGEKSSRKIDAMIRELAKKEKTPLPDVDQSKKL